MKNASHEKPHVSADQVAAEQAQQNSKSTGGLKADLGHRDTAPKKAAPTAYQQHLDDIAVRAKDLDAKIVSLTNVSANLGDNGKSLLAAVKQASSDLLSKVQAVSTTGVTASHAYVAAADGSCAVCGAAKTNPMHS